MICILEQTAVTNCDDAGRPGKYYIYSLVFIRYIVARILVDIAAPQLELSSHRKDNFNLLVLLILNYNHAQYLLHPALRLTIFQFTLNLSVILSQSQYYNLHYIICKYQVYLSYSSCPAFVSPVAHIFRFAYCYFILTQLRIATA